MRRQPYPINNLRGGLDVQYDPTLITDTSSPYVYNMEIYKGVLRRVVTWQEPLGSALSELPMHLDNFYLITGSNYLMCFTLDKAYYYDTTTEDWIFITSSDVFTGDEDNLFSTVIAFDVTGADIVIINNGKDAPQKWEGPSGDWAALGGCSAAGISSAKTGCLFKNHLLLGFTVEGGQNNPFRIRWSDIGNPEEFVKGSSGFVDLSDTVDWVVEIMLLKDQCFVYKERSIWEVIWVGGDRVFEFRMVVDGVGTYSPRTLTTVGDEIFMYGSDNIYAFDGRHARSVGDAINPLLYDTREAIVRRAKLNRACAIYVEELAQYTLVVPSAHDYPDEAFVYDLVESSWWRRNLVSQGFGYWEASAPSSWAAAKATGLAWDDVSGPWRSAKLSEAAPITLRLDYTTKTVMQDKRDPSAGTIEVSASWRSKNFIYEASIRVMEVKLVVKGQLFAFWYSTDGGDTWSDFRIETPAEIDKFTTLTIPMNLHCDQIMFFIEPLDRYFGMRSIVPYHIVKPRDLT